MPNTVIILDGSIPSLVTLQRGISEFYLEQGGGVVHVVSFDHIPSLVSRSINFLVNWYDLERNVKLKWTPIETPDIWSYGDYIPFQEIGLLAMAATFARTMSAVNVLSPLTLMNPLVRSASLGGMAATVFSGNGYPPTILEFPILNSSPGALIQLAARAKLPANLTWTCTDPPKDLITIRACGRCDECKARIEAFKTVGFQDPMPYVSAVDWIGCSEWPSIGEEHD